MRRTEKHERPPHERIGAFTLGFASLGGAFAIAVAFMVNIFLVRGDCSSGAVLSRLVLTAGGLLVTVMATFVSWRVFALTRDRVEEAGGGIGGRNRFLGMFGLGFNIFMIPVLVAMLFNLFFLDSCLRGLDWFVR